MRAGGSELPAPEQRCSERLVRSHQERWHLYRSEQSAGSLLPVLPQSPALLAADESRKVRLTRNNSCGVPAPADTARVRGHRLVRPLGQYSLSRSSRLPKASWRSTSCWPCSGVSGSNESNAIPLEGPRSLPDELSAARHSRLLVADIARPCHSPVLVQNARPARWQSLMLVCRRRLLSLTDPLMQPLSSSCWDALVEHFLIERVQETVTRRYCSVGPVGCALCP